MVQRSRGRLLLWLLLLGHGFAGCRARGIEELQRVMKQPATGHGACDLDKLCEWDWRNDTFEVVNSETLAEQFGPGVDASGWRKGKFLWLSGNTTSQIWSKIIPRTGPKCYLELAVFQIENTNGKISLVIETDNHVNKTSVVAHERPGNNTAKWEKMKINLGDNRNEFRILLEIKLPYDNSSIGLDNIKLVNCFPDQRAYSHEECTDMMFRCRNGSCLKREHVCDFAIDCAEGEDESGVCDQLPKEARCNFENDWCGWTNLKALKWKLGQGPSSKQRMGPVHDHTYRNSNGTYAYVEMSNGNSSMGSEAVLKSPVYNPMPPYHSNPDQPYVNSCKVRFAYFQVDFNNLALGLWMVKLLAHQQKHKEKIFWSFKNTGSRWHSFIGTLPYSKAKYYLEFEGVRGYGSNGLVAIDDFSLSPECFGYGVPASVVGDYNYYDQKSDVPPNHPDFSNASMIVIDTCGQTGRIGPTPEQCTEAHNRTDIEVLSESSVEKGDAAFRSKGIQRWIAPRGGYYTIIAMGARGGKGALATGISLGAMVKGIVELVKGQQLYFMVGQPGTDACEKKLGLKDDLCQKTKSNFTYDKIHEVKKTELRDGGGGGGGATYVFTLNEKGEQVPILIAAGGGGLGSTQFQDDQQDAKGLLTGTSRRPVNGTSFKGNAGGGAGWLPGSLNESNDVSYGMALSKGGVGGVGCSPNHQGFGDGGFGGGGGGCLSGGGGGGYAGGDTGHELSGNGAGGYSYGFPELYYLADAEKQNSGPGEVYVIPEIQGCGCDYRCMAVDQYLSEVRCICPLGWYLGSNQKSCITLGDEQDWTQSVMIVMFAVMALLLSAVTWLCLMLYNRYQAGKIHNSKYRNAFAVDNGNNTELRPISTTMLSEFNPNYEFAGNICSIKDFKNPIPREQIKLIKALGQGAFGEVYQGILHDSEKGVIDVAVKTLPATSTAQANNDFVMEAVIMSQFNHPNIVQFIGVCFNEHPRYIILELLSGGDLKNFLREERPRSDLPTSLTMKDLLDMAENVASGCQYMQEQRFIHRDIAARNCLLTCKGPGRIVKVADFGMARDIYRNEYYKKGGSAMLPIKWMPPESFIDGMFTSKTDVWAYGVLLWEIMSFGYMPYTGCANNEVVTLVSHGGRLGKPACCPDPVYGIMTSCWNSMASSRPDFVDIVNKIKLCKQDPDVMNSPMPSFDILPLADREIMVPGRSDSENEGIDIQAGLDKHGYMQPRVFYRPKATDQPNLVYAALKLEEDRENCNDCKMSPSPDYKNSTLDQHNYNVDTDKLDLCDNREHNNPESHSSELNANVIDASTRSETKTKGNVSKSSQPDGQNGNNGESTTTTDTNSTGTPPGGTSVSSSPNKSASSAACPAKTNNGNDNDDVDEEDANRELTSGGGGGGGGGGGSNNVNGIISRSTSNNNNNNNNNNSSSSSSGSKSALKAALSLDPSALCNRMIPYEKIGFGPANAKQEPAASTELGERVALPREECSC